MEFHGKSMTPAMQVERRFEPHIEGHSHLLQGLEFILRPKGSQERVLRRGDSGNRAVESAKGSKNRDGEE